MSLISGTTPFQKKNHFLLLTFQFINANITLLENEYAGICLQYAAIHGDDDKKEVPKPQDNPAHVQDFKNIIEGYE